MRWYALNTKPRQEKLAETSMQKLGVETFCPQLQQNKVVRRKRQAVVSPLFPGYIFARFNLRTHYRAVKYAHGVHHVVSFGLTPEPVDELIIESIKSRVCDGYITVQPPLFRRGQVVRIQAGLLDGLEAIFEQEMSDHQRAVLLLRTLSYQARVVVDIEQVVNL